MVPVFSFGFRNIYGRAIDHWCNFPLVANLERNVHWIDNIYLHYVQKVVLVLILYSSSQSKEVVDTVIGKLFAGTA